MQTVFRELLAPIVHNRQPQRLLSLLQLFVADTNTAVRTHKQAFLARRVDVEVSVSVEEPSASDTEHPGLVSRQPGRHAELVRAARVLQFARAVVRRCSRRRCGVQVQASRRAAQEVPKKVTVRAHSHDRVVSVLRAVAQLLRLRDASTLGLEHGLMHVKLRSTPEAPPTPVRAAQFRTLLCANGMPWLVDGHYSNGLAMDCTLSLCTCAGPCAASSACCRRAHLRVSVGRCVGACAAAFVAAGDGGADETQARHWMGREVLCGFDEPAPRERYSVVHVADPKEHLLYLLQMCREECDQEVAAMAWSLLQELPTSASVLAELADPTAVSWKHLVEHPRDPKSAYMLQSALEYLQPPLEPDVWMSEIPPSEWTSQFVRCDACGGVDGAVCPRCVIRRVTACLFLAVACAAAAAGLQPCSPFCCGRRRVACRTRFR